MTAAATPPLSPPDGAGPAAERPVPAPGPPKTTLHGIRTVAGHEFRVRLRAGRWRWLLAAWFVVLALFTLFFRKAVDATYEPDLIDPGVPVFGALVLALLGLSLLVVPALTAQSVNGDRERGVLATLQVTLLTPAEIALGKLAAAWGVSLVFLTIALPMVAATMAMGGVGIGRVIPTMLVLAVLLGVVAAIAQCLSSLLARTMTSAVMSYLAVVALTGGTLVTFGLAMTLTQETVTHSQQVEERDPVTGEAIVGRTRTSTWEETRTREDRVWWLLGPNPVVILADAAPEAAPRFDPATKVRLDDPLDPLAEIRKSVRDARMSPDEERRRDMPAPYAYPVEEGWFGYGSTNMGGAYNSTLYIDYSDAKPGPVWPYGLAFDAALGAGAVLITIRRLRTPARKLPRGIRVA
jgi:ABC-2 type transport system permease protein